MTYSAHITVCNFTFLLIVTLQFKKKNSSCSWQEGQFLLPAVDLKTPFFVCFLLRNTALIHGPFPASNPRLLRLPSQCVTGGACGRLRNPSHGPHSLGRRGKEKPDGQPRAHKPGGTAEMLHLTRLAVKGQYSTAPA